MNTQLPESFIVDVLFQDKIARYLLKRYGNGPDHEYVDRWRHARNLREAYGDEEMHRDMYIWEKRRL